ncbi:non-histone protein [Tritrichomonas musculus]|uniref:Non-histone protein n=1 Tax=Tritrichomonas musculus TaxID=1915356 RepID=A0ABR2IN34_9EUKA
MCEVLRKMDFSPNFEVLSIEPHYYKDKPQRKSPKTQKQPNPYFLFCQEKRTQLHTQFPNVSSREITQMLAQEWKSLSTIEKQKYSDQYHKNMEKAQVDKEKKHQIFLQIPVGNNQFMTIPAFVNE